MKRTDSRCATPHTQHHERRRFAWLGLVLLLIAGPLVALPRIGRAQEGSAPLVVFIQGRRPLNTTGISNIGPEGLSKLADIFRDLGADVVYRNITEPLPENTTVVVLVRPLRAIGTVEAARLWTYLEAGGNLLIALDPENTFLSSPSVRATNIRSRIGRGALSELFDADYGIRPYDTLAAEPGFSASTVRTIQTMFSVAWADASPNLLTAPLQQYHLPIWVWGARHMRVEPFVIGGQALPLIHTDTAFGETNPDIFPTGTTALDAATAQIELNLDQDYTGRLNLGAVGTDPRTGSRLAVLGDSEMLQNGFGLVSSGPTPRYPGNWILVERLAAWLLETPEDEWPKLPEGFSWITVDGEGGDWPARGSLSASDPADDVPQPKLDLLRVSGYADNRYVYLLLETQAAPEANTRVTIPLASGPGGGAAEHVVASVNGIVVEREGSASLPVMDAAIGIGAGIELRLPQRLFDEALRITVCTESAADRATRDCLDQPFTVPYTALLAPFDWALVNQRLATVYANGGVFIRSGPGTNASVIGTVRNGTTFAVLSRNADASWIQVQNGNFSGWMAAFLLTSNNNLMLLPESAPPPS